jgi:Uma2 family endonuclease
MSAAPKLVPELENGAVMTREEFHAIYSQCEDLHRVELIEGVVYLPSPISLRQHGHPLMRISRWLDQYADRSPSLMAATPSTVFLDDRNEPEPDAMLIVDTPGATDEDGHVLKVPELIVEVAASSRSRDLHQKKRAYERAGVREYIVWRTRDRALDWFELGTDGRYFVRTPDERGLIESTQFPGLILDVPALLRQDKRSVLAALRD